MRIKQQIVPVILGMILMTMIAFPFNPGKVIRRIENISVPEDLEDLLAKVADYADRLEASVLYFVCREEIKEWINPTLDLRRNRFARDWGISDSGLRELRSTRRINKVKKSYIYDYQCIRKDGQIHERRTLIEEDGKAKNEPNASLKTSYFRYGTNMMGPVGLFGARFQPDYDYTIVGKEKNKGRNILIVEAKPKSENPSTTNLYGTAWLYADTGDILKIEWNENRIIHYEIFEMRGKQFKRTPRIKVSSEFEIEKNGLRFPTHLLLEEAYATKHGRAFVRSETTVEYKDFKFFTVEVEIK